MLERLFTYGSLMPGKQYAHLLAEAAGEWQPATITALFDANGWGHSVGYPALIINDSGTVIEGMLLTSSLLHRLWPSLDEYEGDAYQRIVTKVSLADGSQVDAYVYELHKDLQSTVDTR